MKYFVTAFSSVMGIGLMLSVVYQNPLVLGVYFFAALVAGSMAELVGRLLGAAAPGP